MKSYEIQIIGEASVNVDGRDKLAARAKAKSSVTPGDITREPQVESEGRVGSGWRIYLRTAYSVLVIGDRSTSIAIAKVQDLLNAGEIDLGDYAVIRIRPACLIVGDSDGLAEAKARVNAILDLTEEVEG